MPVSYTCSTSDSVLFGVQSSKACHQGSFLPPFIPIVTFAGTGEAVGLWVTVVVVLPDLDMIPSVGGFCDSSGSPEIEVRAVPSLQHKGILGREVDKQ